MKVAVSATSAGLSSTVDPRFGRASTFVIVDTESGADESRANQRASRMSHGAGPLAASMLATLGVKAVITGNVGPNAFDDLQAADIGVYLVYAGTVQSVVERFKAGRIERANRPSRKGHF